MKAPFTTSVSLVLQTYSHTCQPLALRPRPSLYHRLYHSLPLVQHRIVTLTPKETNIFSLSNSICRTGSASEPFCVVICSKTYATAANPKKPESNSSASNKSLTEASEGSGAVTVSLGEKVKENAKTGGYGLVIVAGIAITGGLLWVILSELFSSDSPNNIYTHAFKLCKLSPDVQDALGTPIKCHGEETRRGWRRHVSHVEFFQGNTKYLRMRFFVEGPFKKGTVHLEKKKNERGKYEYTYLFVDIESYPPRRIEVHF